MLWAQSPRAVAVSLATGRHLSVPMATGRRDAGAGCAELLSAGSQLSSPEHRLWAHSGALILQLTRRSELEVFLLPV